MDRVADAALVTRVDVLFGLAYHPDVRVQRLARSLAANGYAVRVLAWDRTGSLPGRERDGSVEIRRVRVRSKSGRGWSQLFFLARAVLEFVPEVRRDPPRVLHAVDLPMLLAAIVLAPLTGRRPRLVYDAFEIYALMESHKYPRWLVRLIGAAERVLPRFADLVLTPGEGRRDYFLQRGISSTVVGNWTDPPRSVPDRLSARRELGVDPSRFCLIYAGGLERSRDIDALRRHAERVSSDLVLIAGRGEQEAMVRAAAARLSNVRFLGWVRDPSVLYAAADACFYALRPDHPYAAHPAPNTLYAAIAHALPLVYRPQGELAVVGASHRIGIQFKDDESLDRAIDQLRTPSVAHEIRSELRRLQKTYSWNEAEKALLAVYPGRRSGE